MEMGITETHSHNNKLNISHPINDAISTIVEPEGTMDISTNKALSTNDKNTFKSNINTSPDKHSSSGCKKTIVDKNTTI